MKVRIVHELNCDADTYWNRIFFDAEYNRRVYKEALGFETFEVHELREDAAGVVRRVSYVPRIELPAVARKALGEKVQYTEEGRFDRAAQRYRYQMRPGAMADRISITGEIWLEPKGPGKVTRISEVEVAVKIIGIGGTIEKIIEKSVRENYETSAAFTNQWLREIAARSS